jgi:hypothetical protein
MRAIRERRKRMANNRLYVVNTELKAKVCIAKNFGGEWQLGNKELFMEMLDSTFEAEGTDLIFVTENDDEGYEKYIANDEYRNINITNKWDANWES